MFRKLRRWPGRYLGRVPEPSEPAVDELVEIADSQARERPHAPIHAVAALGQRLGGFIAGGMHRPRALDLGTIDGDECCFVPSEYTLFHGVAVPQAMRASQASSALREHRHFRRCDYVER